MVPGIMEVKRWKMVELLELHLPDECVISSSVKMGKRFYGIIPAKDAVIIRNNVMENV
jgi:hypothetical protein